MLKHVLVQKTLSDDSDHPIRYRKIPKGFGSKKIIALQDGLFSYDDDFANEGLLKYLDYLSIKSPIPEIENPYGFASNYGKKKFIISSDKFYDYLTQYPSTYGDVQNDKTGGTNNHSFIFEKKEQSDILDDEKMPPNCTIRWPHPILSYQPLVSNGVLHIPYDFGAIEKDVYAFLPHCSEPSLSYSPYGYASNGDENLLFNPFTKEQIITHKLVESDTVSHGVLQKKAKKSIAKNFFFAPIKKDSFVTKKFVTSDLVLPGVTSGDEEMILPLYYLMDHPKLT